jgi:riboflavin synthase
MIICHSEMFTGIIESKAHVLEIAPSAMLVERPQDFDDLRIGSSVCVSGCCLSVIEMDENHMKFDVMEETWNKTKLKSLSKGDSVNLERALKADGRFEGHIVQGHVDCTAKVVDVMLSRSERVGSGSRASLRAKLQSCETKDVSKHEDEILTIEIPSNLQGLIVQKGSIAIDGVSLTVSKISDSTFSVALIPHTIEQTTLGNLKAGDTVNLEADILGKYVRSQ